VLLPLRDELRLQLSDYHRNFAARVHELSDVLTTYIQLLPPPQTPAGKVCSSLDGARVRF
jgi:hypothetical protein